MQDKKLEAIVIESGDVVASLNPEIATKAHSTITRQRISSTHEPSIEYNQAIMSGSCFLGIYGTLGYVEIAHVTGKKGSSHSHKSIAVIGSVFIADPVFGLVEMMEGREERSKFEDWLKNRLDLQGHYENMSSQNQTVHIDPDFCEEYSFLSKRGYQFYLKQMIPDIFEDRRPIEQQTVEIADKVKQFIKLIDTRIHNSNPAGDQQPITPEYAQAFFSRYEKGEVKMIGQR